MSYFLSFLHTPSVAFQPATSRRVFGLLMACGLSVGLPAAELEVLVTDLDGRAIPGVAAILHDVAAVEASQAYTIGKTGHIEIDQVDEQFVPAMSIVPRGSEVWFPNSDNVRHHVYSFSSAKSFELSLYHADEAPPVEFDKSGIVTLGCNIHDSMRAAVVVTEQAVFGVTDERGKVLLKYQPPATSTVLTLGLWHEQLGTTEALETRLEEPRLATGSITTTLPIRFRPLAPQSMSDLKSRLRGYRQQ